MKFILQYLRHRRPRYLLLGVFIGVFALCFALYRLPLAALLYPSLLCVCIGGTVTLFDLLRIKKAKEKLSRITDFDEFFPEQLPAADAALDEDYKALFERLTNRHRAAQTKQQQQIADMTDYYTVWAHQIKTPIASMHLHLQNEDSALSGKLSSDLHRIEQYVEMVLTYLRLHADSTDYLIKEYPLDPILRQALRKFSHEFIGRKLRLCYEPADCSVLTDEKWLSFVIEQLLSNALKYTQSGSITVTAKDSILTIRDTGIGIAPEDLPRIFENGFTGYNGRSDKRASGIGLYLCKRICQNLGHSIRITSVIDEGTLVTLDLSRNKAKQHQLLTKP